MAVGFDPERKNKSKKISNGALDNDDSFLGTDFDDIDEFLDGDLDLDSLDTEELDKPKQPPKKKSTKPTVKTPTKRPPIKRKEHKEDVKKTKKTKKPMDKKKALIIALSGFVVVILVVVFCILIFGGKDDKPPAQTSGTLQSSSDSNIPASVKNAKPKDGSGSDDQSSDADEPKDVTPGVPDLQYGDNMKQNSDTSNPKDFLKDINGNKIPKNYEVNRIEHATDFIDYTKKRGITGDGTELLWLDAKYKGRPYVVQVPFSIYKELDSSGITVVDVEILHLKGGAKVVTYMRVRDDYKQLLNKNKGDD